MNPDEFAESPSGVLVPTIARQVAFVPNRLPPRIDFAALAIPMTTAMQAIGELNGAGGRLADPALVIRPLQRKEALLSSRMEGTYTTANALAMAEADGEAYVDASTIEVRNYIRAFETANQLRRSLPISNRLIKATHRELLSGVPFERGANKRPGEYKDQQNFIGGRNRQIENARFVPPPPAETEIAMADLERYINREDKAGIPPIIDAGLLHYQFETIHPFADGNGRVGRILIPLFLMQEKILERPLLYVSPAVEGKKDDYVDLMLNVSRKGDWTSWLLFFLETVNASCKSACQTLSDLETLRQDFKNRIISVGGTARDVAIVDRLFISPVVSIPHVATQLDVTYPSGKAAVDRLIGLGILEEIESTSNPKLFICWPIVHLSEGLPDVETQA